MELLLKDPKSIFERCYDSSMNSFLDRASRIHFKKISKHLFLDHFNAGDFVGAASTFNNYNSVGREKFVWICFKNKIITREKFSELLGYVYTSANRSSGFRILFSNDEILKMFKYADYKFLMNKYEYRKFKNLGDNFFVYRGGLAIENNYSWLRNGIGWTLKKKVALMFSQYYSTDETKIYKKVIKGIIKKEFVYAYFNERKEQEIICDPSKIIFEE